MSEHDRPHESIVVCSAHRERQQIVFVVALHRSSGDSPADLAAATNSVSFEGTTTNFGDLPLSNKPRPFSWTDAMVCRGLFTLGDRASTKISKEHFVCAAQIRRKRRHCQDQFIAAFRSLSISSFASTLRFRYVATGMSDVRNWTD